MMYYRPQEPENEQARKKTSLTDEEIIRYIFAKEGFKSKPYDSKDGKWTIGYGYVIRDKDNKDNPNEVYVDKGGADFANGITEEQAVSLAMDKHNKLVNMSRNVLKQNGIDFDELPSDIQTGIKIFSYGGWLNKDYSKGFIEALKKGKESGFDKESRLALAQNYGRGMESTLGGVKHGANVIRGMLMGEVDFDVLMKDVDDGKFYSNEMKQNYSQFDNTNINTGKINYMPSVSRSTGDIGADAYRATGIPTGKEPMINVETDISDEVKNALELLEKYK